MKLQRYAEQQLQRLRDHLNEALATGEATAVHQARVCSRRLTEPLRLYKNDKIITRALKQLRAIRRAMANLRELDVLLASLNEPDARHDPAALTTEDLQALRAELSDQRGRVWRKTQRKSTRLNTKTVENAVAHISSLQDTPPPERRLNRRINRQARRVMEGVSRYNGNADLHPIRLKLKRLRYAVELCLALNEEPCEDFIAQFKAVQDRLGEWNDQHAAVDRLCRIARRRSVMMNRPEWAMHLLSNAAGRLRKAQELAEAFRAEWPTFTKALSKYVSENKTRV